jgi:uncharacterized membrane protein YvlD (DUF360 family)
MTVTATAATFRRPRLDVGLAFKNGWHAFTSDIVPFLVGALIAGILSVITLGILAGPLTAGLYNMAIRRLRDGRRAEIGDVFSCFDRFWSYLWAALVLFVLVGLASLTIVGGVLLATIWIYVFPFMVDRRMGLGEAMSASYHRVVDNGFWEHLALIVIFAAIGAVANGWVGIITTPFTIAVIAGAYFASRDYERKYVAAPATPPAPPAPPAPMVQTAPPAAPAPAAQTFPAAETAAPADDAAVTQATATESPETETPEDTEAAPSAETTGQVETPDRADSEDEPKA